MNNIEVSAPSATKNTFFSRRLPLQWIGRTVQKSQTDPLQTIRLEIRLIFDSKITKLLPAERKLLMEKSDYFKAALSSETMSHPQNPEIASQTLDIRLETFSPEITGQLFELIGKDPKPILNEDNINEFLKISDYFQFEELKNECEKWLWERYKENPDEIKIKAYFDAGTFPFLAQSLLTNEAKHNKPGLKSFLENYGRFLLSFKLSDLETSDQSDEFLKLLSETCANLKNLDLSRCPAVTDNGVSYLSHLKHLKSINLAYCKQITDAAIAHLQNARGLESLNLNSCEKITDVGAASLAALGSLRQLNLNGCSALTDKGVEHLSKLPKIEELHMAFCPNISGKIIPILKTLPNLTHLSLLGCEQLRPKAGAIDRLGLIRCAPPSKAQINRLFDNCPTQDQT